MEEAFKEISAYIALALETVAVLVVAFGAGQAFWGIIRITPSAARSVRRKKEVWVGFGVWLLMGLEFELGADIVRTVIAPTWAELGQLGAIAVIRTFLNFFLERDLEKYAEPEARQNSS